jgi:hypothetical protein
MKRRIDANALAAQLLVPSPRNSSHYRSLHAKATQTLEGPSEVIFGELLPVHVVGWFLLALHELYRRFISTQHSPARVLPGTEVVYR